MGCVGYAKGMLEQLNITRDAAVKRVRERADPFLSGIHIATISKGRRIDENKPAVDSRCCCSCYKRGSNNRPNQFTFRRTGGSDSKMGVRCCKDTASISPRGYARQKTRAEHKHSPRQCAMFPGCAIFSPHCNYCCRVHQRVKTCTLPSLT